MRILVMAATAFEIEPFTRAHPGIEVLVTGVGLPAALYQLQKRLVSKKDCDLVVQAGIAGSFTPNLALGETVLVKKDCFADLGMEEKEKFTPIFKSGFADKDAFPFKDGWLLNPSPLFDKINLPQVAAVTVNKVSDSHLQRRQLSDHFSPTIESMEGAALHYVCLQENIGFMQVRSISNFVGERDKAKWKIKEAITNLNHELGLLVELINGIN